MLPWLIESSADRFNDVRDTSLAELVKSDMLALLDDAVQAMEAAASRHEGQHYYGENLRFHWAIVESARNHSLTES